MDRGAAQGGAVLSVRRAPGLPMEHFLQGNLVLVSPPGRVKATNECVISEEAIHGVQHIAGHHLQKRDKTLPVLVVKRSLEMFGIPSSLSNPFINYTQ